MLTIQIIGLVVIFITIIIVLLRFKKRQISLVEFSSWILFWTIIAILVADPSLMTKIARFFGVGRGVDVIIYIALFLIFYLIFKINLRQEKIEQEITEIVKEIALKKKK